MDCYNVALQGSHLRSSKDLGRGPHLSMNVNGLRLNARTRAYRVPFCVYFIIIGVKQHILFVVIIIIINYLSQ